MSWVSTEDNDLAIISIENILLQHLTTLLPATYGSFFLFSVSICLMQPPSCTFHTSDSDASSHSFY